MRRTPAKILKEIVLVDDASNDPSIGSALTQIEKVKLVVNRQREGLIRSRIRAAMVAQGDTLTFLDSHVEVNEMWIEPLMSKIKVNYKMVVAPIIGKLLLMINGIYFVSIKVLIAIIIYCFKENFTD